MAEALGVVSGIISIIGFSGQLAQGSAFLYDFFRDVKDAPEDIKKISDELLIVTLILKEIQSSSTTETASMGPALVYCEGVISDLSDVVKKLESTPNMRKGRRIWRHFKTGLRRSEIAKHLGRLERAKSMLLQYFAKASRHSQFHQLDLLQEVNKSVSDLALKQAASSSSSLAIQESLKALNSVMSDLNAACSQISATTSHTHMMIMHLAAETQKSREESSKVEAASLNLLNDALSRQPELLQSLNRSDGLRNQVKQALREHAKQHSRQPERMADQNTRSKSATTLTLQPGSGIIRNAPNQCTDQWLKESSSSNHRVLVQTGLFGTIQVMTTTVTYSSQKRPSEGHTKKQEISHSLIMYWPDTWLLRTGVILKRTTWKLLGESWQPMPDFSFSLRTINLIPEDSDIIDAWMNLDLASILTLPWHPDQLLQICNLQNLNSKCSSDLDAFRKAMDRLRFIVTSTAEQFQEHLKARANLLRMLLEYNVRLSKPQPGSCWYRDAIHCIVDSGGELLSILTKHDYYGHEPPWLRHRFRKLLHTRAFMISSIIDLLEVLWSESPDLTESYCSDITTLAQSHNERTLNIWMTALRRTGVKFPNTLADIAIDEPLSQNISDGPDDRSINDAEGWETETSTDDDSGWETEEEWEEGYMLDKAIDRDHYDDRNTQFSNAGQGRKDRDFDEEYWSNGYQHLKSHNDRGDQKSAESTLKSVFKAAKRAFGY
ncbi:hypothetical protein GGR54DRAFT_652638 [Hypoxylon sp. NC1633]|nr:hypothetical protein GGR54DRAFT_652638 [Hypoxylon sp. NC1633]